MLHYNRNMTRRRRRTRALLAGGLLAGIGLLPPTAHAAEVVVSIKPLHSLVQAVMGTIGSAHLLLQGNASPHGFHLKPSQLRALQQADVVFYVHESFETFLQKALAGLAPSTHKVAMIGNAELTLLQRRPQGRQHAHRTYPPEHATTAAVDQLDPHVWLDPDNAAGMVTAIATALSEVYPQHGDTYHANAQQARRHLERLAGQLADTLAEVREQPFLVFHDAYQYFERRYALRGVGFIALDPHQPASAYRIRELRSRLENSGAVCVFYEPQFHDRVVRTVTEGSWVKSAALDPLGSNLRDGPDLYPQLLRQLADDLVACLH